MWRYGDKEGYRGPAWSGGREELEARAGGRDRIGEQPPADTA
jgi:hypothetical protein